MVDLKLKDKVTIITGAGRGMGREAALLFASDDSSYIIGAVLVADGGITIQ